MNKTSQVFICSVSSNAVYALVDEHTKDITYIYAVFEDAVYSRDTRTAAGYPCYIKELYITPMSTSVKIKKLVTEHEERADLMLAALRATDVDQPPRFQTPSQINNGDIISETTDE